MMIWRRRWSVSKYRQGNNAKKPKRFRRKIKLVKWYDDEEPVGFLYLGKYIYRYIERYYYSFYAIGIKDCWQWLLAFLLNTKWHHYDENLPFSLLFFFFVLLSADAFNKKGMEKEIIQWITNPINGVKTYMDIIRKEWMLSALSEVNLWCFLLRCTSTLVDWYLVTKESI